MPNPIGDFTVCTDASFKSVGVVLMQDDRVILSKSRKLKDHELNYHTHDLEHVVVVHALMHWRYFLLGHRFELHSGYRSLQYIFT